MADDEFNISKQVDLLLGANILFDVLCIGQIKLGIGKPVFQKTKFGWVLTGSMRSENLNFNVHKNYAMCPFRMIYCMIKLQNFGP